MLQQHGSVGESKYPQKPPLFDKIGNFQITRSWIGSSSVRYKWHVDCCRLNADEFTPLDVALMCGEVEIASILLEHGGKENPACKFATDPWNFFYMKYDNQWSYDHIPSRGFTDGFRDWMKGIDLISYNDLYRVTKAICRFPWRDKTALSLGAA